MTKMMMTGVTVVPAMKVKTVLMMTTVKVQTCCTKQKRTKYKKREVPRIIRYVKYNKKKDPENYIREQLMFFVPWRNEQKDLLGCFDTYEAHFNSVQTSLIPKRNEYGYHIEELKLARQMMEDEQTALNAEQADKEAEEEGSKQSEQFVYFNPSRVVEHRNYDIGIELHSTCSVPPVENWYFVTG